MLQSYIFFHKIYTYIICSLIYFIVLLIYSNNSFTYPVDIYHLNNQITSEHLQFHQDRALELAQNNNSIKTINSIVFDSFEPQGISLDIMNNVMWIQLANYFSINNINHNNINLISEIKYLVYLNI